MASLFEIIATFIESISKDLESYNGFCVEKFGDWIESFKETCFGDMVFKTTSVDMLQTWFGNDSPYYYYILDGYMCSHDRSDGEFRVCGRVNTLKTTIRVVEHIVSGYELTAEDEDSDAEILPYNAEREGCASDAYIKKYDLLRSSIEKTLKDFPFESIPFSRHDDWDDELRMSHGQ
jgi:hypothetical protein